MDENLSEILNMKKIELSIGTEKEIDELSDQLFNFNKKIVPSFEGKDSPIDVVRYVLKKEKHLVAGIVGKIAINNVVFIDDLFVIEDFRKQGCASTLLAHLETEAKSRGCYLAYLNTISADAVRFYENRKYTIFATLENVPCPGVRDVYMKKDL